MMTNEPVRTFETPNVADVAAVTIHQSDANDGKPFYAAQYYHRDTFENGILWLDERDTYIKTEAYRRAVAESTHIPIEDIRLELLPVAEPGVI